MTENWFLAMIVFPLIINVFKAEISNAWIRRRVYDLRAFDTDGDPNTPDETVLRDNASGEWEVVTIDKYVYSWNVRTQGVYIIHADGRPEKIDLLDWKGMRKSGLSLSES